MEAVVTRAPTVGLTPGALLRLARPKQWSKNVLVFAAPGAAGVLDQATPLAQTIGALACFCLAASGTYFLNDARDVEADRRHPTKRNRPVASGAITTGTATAGGVVLMIAAIAAGTAIRPELGITVAGYCVVTTTYSIWLKEVAVVDLVGVAAGFVIRAIGGATATDVPISEWFFIVASFGALFMVSGKRGAEAVELGQEQAATVRTSLASYSSDYVAYLRSVSSSALLVAYCLWAFDKAAETDASVPLYQLSIVPFAVGVLRYAMLLDQGQGSAPEDVVLGDRTLQIIGLVWVLIFGLGVYLA